MSEQGIFDMHQHVGQLHGVGERGQREVTLAEDCRTRIDFMDRFGIAQAALMPGHSYQAPRGLADIGVINDNLLTLARMAPARFPALFGTVDPRHGLAGIAEIGRLHELGFRGLSWHHRMQGLPMDHPIMFALVEEMDRRGMTVMVHCYAQGDFEAPWRLRRLAEHFPATRFVALDAMTSMENLEQLLAMASILKNIFLDLTITAVGATGLKTAIEQIGAARLLLGTNFYSMSRGSVILAQEAIDDAALCAEDRDRILGHNARRLLGIEQS